MTTYRGGCHCGAVRFEMRRNEPIHALLDCNCSLCTKKGILHIGVEHDDFTLLTGPEDLALYQFGTRTAKHWFCRHCGMHTHNVPRNNPHRLSVNARCLDDIQAILPNVAIEPFDGINHPKDRPA